MVGQQLPLRDLLPERLRGSLHVGDPFDIGVLERAGVVGASCVVAATGRDVRNLALAFLCRTAFGTGHVMARVEDPRRSSTSGRMGVETLCTTLLATSAVARFIERVADDGPRPSSRHGEPIMRSLHIIVVGCGRLGSHLANLLSGAGHRVMVVDRDEDAFQGLSSESFSGFRVAGDASEPGVLRRSKIDQADLLIAATSEDNVNLMVALVARKVFGVKHVMARVYDPRREEMYRELGLETVCPTLMAGEAFFKLVFRALDGGDTE